MIFLNDFTEVHTCMEPTHGCSGGFEEQLCRCVMLLQPSSHNVMH